MFVAFMSAKHRCNNKNYWGFHRYGGRGIKILWKNYKEFKKDMESTWKPGLSLDRINNNGNYEKGNCRWATNREQSANMKTNVLVEYEGKTLILKDWARKLNIKYETLHGRISRGWTIEKAFKR